VFLADYRDEYEEFANAVSYPSDKNQIDFDKLLRVLDYYHKKYKIES
jgi:hypothetical protein